jgi:hypothetical protein
MSAKKSCFLHSSTYLRLTIVISYFSTTKFLDVMIVPMKNVLPAYSFAPRGHTRAARAVCRPSDLAHVLPVALGKNLSWPIKHTFPWPSRYLVRPQLLTRLYTLSRRGGLSLAGTPRFGRESFIFADCSITKCR